MERRIRLTEGGVEIRDVEDKPRIAGLAAVYYDAEVPGSEYEMFADFVERIHPGAFDGALDRQDDAVALFNHDPNQVLGRVSSGTLSLKASKRGLEYFVDPPATAAGRDVVELVRRGDIVGSSFAFSITDEDWETEEGRTVRNIRGVKLYDVSPVTYPAYQATTVGLRAEAVQERERAALAASEERAALAALTDNPRRLTALRLRQRLLGIDFPVRK